MITIKMIPWSTCWISITLQCLVNRSGNDSPFVKSVQSESSDCNELFQDLIFFKRNSADITIEMCYHYISTQESHKFNANFNRMSVLLKGI